MEGFMIRGWNIILSGGAGCTKTGGRVSTPCVAVSTRHITGFVPGLLEL